MSDPYAVGPHPKISKKKFRPLNAWLIVAAILVVLVLTGLAWNKQISQTAMSSPIPTLDDQDLLTATPTVVVNNSDETSGLILAGAFLVLIILGGTLAATRRKS
jgi:hypothetical protein